MKTVVTIVAGLLLAAISAVADESAVEKANAGKQVAPHFMSLAEAQAQAAKDDRNIVIDFYTDWCTWCHRFDTINMVDQKTIDFFSKEMILADVNAEVDTAIAKKFAISGYPTFVLLDAKGNEIDRIAGYLETDDYIKTLRDYKNGIGTLDAQVAQAKTDTSRSLAYEIADKYKYRGMSTEAETWYNKIIAVNAKDSLAGESRVAIADMYRRSKNYPKALAAFKAVAVDFKGTQFEETGDIYTAVVYRKSGDTANAITAFEAFAQKYPKSEDREYAQDMADIMKADVIGRTGKPAAAIAAYEAFLTNHPKSDNLEYAQKQIEKLKGTTASDSK